MLPCSTTPKITQHPLPGNASSIGAQTWIFQITEGISFKNCHSHCAHWSDPRNIQNLNPELPRPGESVCGSSTQSLADAYTLIQRSWALGPEALFLLPPWCHRWLLQLRTKKAQPVSLATFWLLLRGLSQWFPNLGCILRQLRLPEAQSLDECNLTVPNDPIHLPHSISHYIYADPT